MRSKNTVVEPIVFPAFHNGDSERTAIRVRKPSNKGGVKKVISKFPSLRMDRVVWAEGMIELDYIYLLEYDHPHVNYFAEQPCRINYYLDGRWRRYTPDFYVERTDKRLIVEVKQERDLLSEDNRCLFRIISGICRQYGFEFIVVTDRMIRVQPRLDNIKILTRYERTDISDPQYQVACSEFFSKRHEASLGEVVQFFASYGIDKQVVYGLLYWGIIAIDLMNPISPESIVHMPTNDIL